MTDRFLCKIKYRKTAKRFHSKFYITKLTTSEQIGEMLRISTKTT